MNKFYTGGTILTLNGQPNAKAILVNGGRLSQVGDPSKWPLDDAQTTMLDGACLTPAFIDAHGHFTQVACAMTQAQLMGAGSEDQIKEIVSTYIRDNQTPSGEWVVAQGFEETVLPMLDQLAPDHALMIQHCSGHMGFFNQRARELLGLGSAQLTEKAYFDAASRVPLPSRDKLLYGFQKAKALYQRNGITLAQDGCVTRAMLPVYQTLLKADLSGLRLVAYAEPEIYETLKAMLKDTKIELGGVKLFLDGSPQAKTAWLSQPYEGGGTGTPVMTDHELIDKLRFCAHQNAQVIVHANGDEAIEQFLRCLAIIQGHDVAFRYLRPVLIHAQLMRRDQLIQAARMQVIVSFFVGHVYHFGDTHIQNLGRLRASGISPARSAIDAGLCVTFHQDAPVTAPDMLETIWCASARQTMKGTVLGQDERISPIQALAAVTKNAAYQYSLDKETGTLQAGKRADFVILSDDPTTCPIERIREIKILETIKDGQTVYRQGS